MQNKLEKQIKNNNLESETIDFNYYNLVNFYYVNWYKRISYTNLGLRSLRYMHKSIDKVAPIQDGDKILEIGAGGGEHLDYVNLKFEKYILSDLYFNQSSEIFKKLSIKNVEFLRCEASQLPFQDNSFDKVILTCVLAHVENVQKTLEELRRVTRPGGKLILYLPCDPGWLYRTGRWLIPRLTAKKHGVDAVKDFCDALDHKNAFLNMHYQALWAFRNDSLRYIRGPFPFNKLWWQLQAFQINEIAIQK